MKTIEQAITTRRTAKTSTTEPVAREQLLTLLEQASYAPFHKKEPWLAKIITSEPEKRFLFDQIIDFYQENGLIHDEASAEKFTTKMTRLILNAPATILFAHEVFPEQPRLHHDAIQATAALIQNFSLLLDEQNLVGFWASSPFVLEPAFAAKIGLPDNFQLIANYRIGYRPADQKQRTAKRRAVSEWATPLLP